MQFVSHGPDIPDALLQEHEDGRVVFFCGAGVSYPAGLPGFKGLVDEIFRRNGTAPSDIERVALDRGQYDAALDLLERRLPGQRLAVRRALADALKPKLRRKGATETHAALLHLARNREGALRLVTTNFDRVFQVAAERSGQVFAAHAAPMLPIPKSSRWDGLVYLHGLLSEGADDTALNRLVVTSGDFGLAYLTERWAARFVSELFRNYVVCFVGYSINDPVLRYMMDALAADRMLGEVTPQAWALGDCEPGQERPKTVEWEAKGVAPILYPVAAGTHDHSALHQTLQAWAQTYRDGVTGKERIVVAHAIARPSASTLQDDFVGRMLWALSDPSGLPARRFAEFNPVPSLDWLLDAFAVDRYDHSDLVRFGVPPRSTTDPKLRFSLVHRPAPYTLAPPMRLVRSGAVESDFDAVMRQLARWLVRHVDDPRLVLWIAARGGQLHEDWRRLFEGALDRIAKLKQEGQTAELDDIRAHAANAIPRPEMDTLWRLILGGHIKSPWSDLDLYRWNGRLRRDGLTTTVRLELRALLEPKIRLRKPFRWRDEVDGVEERGRVRDLVDWELVLRADHVHVALRDIDDAEWRVALPALLEDMQQLLRDALDLLCELGEADARGDRSHWDLPSISRHWQNRGFRDWVVLIELLRESWLAVRNTDPDRASGIAMRWFDVPYPAFKRLALFGASHDGCVAPQRWVGWLLVDGGWWLWSTEVHREVMRLLTLQGAQLHGKSQRLLERAILKGPPREMYKGDLSPNVWAYVKDRGAWLRLAKLESSGLKLGPAASRRLHELSLRNPDWRFESHEAEEFLHWMSGTGDVEHDESWDIEVAPRTWRDLVVWLNRPQPDRRAGREDNWRDLCRTRFFHTWYALRQLALRDIWPLRYWREALQVWGEDASVVRAWRLASPLIGTMPDSVVRQLADAVTSWLRAASKSIDRHEPVLVSMCLRILALPVADEAAIWRGDGEPMQEPVAEAINHPVGHVTEALLNLWFKRKPSDGDGLSADILPLFTEICDVQVRRFRHGRVLLASRVIALFRVDRPWTEQYLLPRFDWAIDRAEAKAVWEGFLWSPRLYGPLLVALKSEFLESAHHYGELGEHGRQFAAFLTYAALGPVDGYKPEDWRAAFSALPPEALEEAAQAMAQALEGAADQREQYWKNRVRPLWQKVWPKSRDLATPGVAESLARLSIAAGDSFPEALDAVSAWLQPVAHPFYVVHVLLKSGLGGRFPIEALRLLSVVVSEQILDAKELRKCLDQITSADVSVLEHAAYRRLDQICRKQAH